jgi:hypothetical protein
MIPKNKEKPKHLGRGLESLLGPIITTVQENMIRKFTNFCVRKQLVRAPAFV